MKKISKKYRPKKKIIPLVMGLANRIIKELEFEKKINDMVEWDKNHWQVSPGGLIKSLVLTTFADLRTPLTGISKKLEDLDIEYLIGRGATSENINAFNVGRALERLGEKDYNKLYESLALSAIQLNGISSKKLHADTTTISFYGEYEGYEMELTEEERREVEKIEQGYKGNTKIEDKTKDENVEVVKIERGYNKDGRPTCKQVVVGQIVNEAGIPIISRTMDGATSDIEWNKKALECLGELVEKGFSNGIYVADSKLITKDLVLKMIEGENKVSFVSRCPASFENKLESRMIDKAYCEDKWEEIGQYHEGKDASIYKGISFFETVCSATLRLLVLHSSKLQIKAEARLEKQREVLEQLIKELEKKKFACIADVQLEIARFMKHKKLKLFDCEFEIEKNIQEKWPRGRRSEKTKPKITESYQIKVKSVTKNELEVTRFLHNESCFVVISNVLKDVDNCALLGIYKGQQVVENSFRLLKQPSLASVIYLKNPKRIQALSMVLTFSLLIRAIIQYKMRTGLKKFNEENQNATLKIGWQGRPLKNPTYKLFFEHAKNCYFEKEDDDEYSIGWYSQETEYKVTTLLSLMGIQIMDLLE